MFSKLKIAIICPNYPPSSFEGGISHYSRLLGEQLLNNGHKVFAITSSEFRVQLSRKMHPDSSNRIFIRGPWNHRAVYEIKKLVKELELNIIILQYTPASFNMSFRFRWALTHFPCSKVTSFHTLWGKTIDRIFGVGPNFNSNNRMTFLNTVNQNF